LKQALHNLLDNALDASPERVAMRTRQVEGELEFAVSDAGPGFTAEMLAGLGTPYNSTKGRLGGGLGLFLVVNVVRKLGGQVEARNRDDGGAVVTVRLPLASLTIERSA
jgi:two-component system sensor histidine kinase RegB